MSPYDVAPIKRRACWLGAAVIAVVVVVVLVQHPAPGLRGTGLGISAALIVLIGATLLLLRARTRRMTAAALVLVALSCVALVWLQPASGAVAGLFVVAGFAAMLLPDRESLPILAVAATALIPAAVHGHRSTGAIVGIELGIAAFFLIARFAREAAEAHAETQRVLVQLEAGRLAEAEAAALRERSRLAREMHDVLAHSLSGLMLQLEGARMLSTQPQSNGELPAALERAHHLAGAGLSEARRAIAALRDDALPDVDRIEQLAADFERDSCVSTSFAITGPARELDSEASLTMYRVAQEALTNVRKHARPELVELCLRYEPDGTRLTVLDRADQPATAPPPAESGGYGLTGMRERAELLGGALRAGPTPNGFRVELWIPA
jgi:signal transduction histidine kinase